MKLISFSMPIRSHDGHLDMMFESIQSIIDTVSDVKKVEVILRFDDDDDVWKHHIDEIDNLPIDTIMNYGDRMGGWMDNHKFHTENCELSKGEFIQLWSDDLLMMTPNFDEIIQHKYSGKTCVTSWKDDKDWVSAPMISVDIFDVTGTFGKSTFCDSYLCDLGSRCEVYYYDESIYVKHDRFDITGNNKHSEYLEQQNVYKEAISIHKSRNTLDLLNSDVNLLKDYLDKN